MVSFLLTRLRFNGKSCHHSLQIRLVWFEIEGTFRVLLCEPLLGQVKGSPQRLRGLPMPVHPVNKRAWLDSVCALAAWAFPVDKLKTQHEVGPGGEGMEVMRAPGA